jgi:hypothetical protein
MSGIAEIIILGDSRFKEVDWEEKHKRFGQT